MTDRTTFIKLIQTSLSAARADFARHAATDWLEAWPGDTAVQTYLARAEMELGNIEAAKTRVMRTIDVDPEQVDAYLILASCLRTSGKLTQAQVYQACARILDKEPLDPGNALGWTGQLEEAMKLATLGEYDAALAKVSIALTADPGFLLPTYCLMSIYHAAGRTDAAIDVAQNGLQRWPDCSAFLLLLGHYQMEHGEGRNAVGLLHRAASLDPAGQVARRLLGEDHAYARLWPLDLQAELSRPIPADVVTRLGDNQLDTRLEPLPFEPMQASGEEAKQTSSRPSPTGRTKTAGSIKLQDDPLPLPQPWEAFRGPNAGEDQPQSPKPQGAEVLLDVDSEFRRLAQRLNARRRARDEDGRSPAYIVVSSRTHLMQRFDEAGFNRIDLKILKLVEAVRRRYGWTAYRFYIDDPATMEAFELSPVDPGNPWQIKLRIADLDRTLARRGEMIGAVLIVGGDGIIPFHLLPNPTDDDDDTIPSDNPYATSDENYFIPEWPVGRIPGESDPELIAHQLDYALKNHQSNAAPQRSFLDVVRWVRTGFRRILSPRGKTLGYSASIWRKASYAVYKTIGDPRSMITSPPTEASRLPSQAMRPALLSYFNLHGLEDSPEWYGQRDPLRDQSASIEFPIALRPSDVINSGRAPQVVFTEACYGANTIGKNAESALSLKFLASGSRAVVGSTKISYGSITPPLIAADLLGQSFWHHLNLHLPVGEALRRAKMKLATEMHRRQGYLDGEDQKTLISFVLYGDPLFQPSPATPQPGKKTVIRRLNRPSAINTACALGGKQIEKDDLSPATMKRIEHIVAQYLPGMTEAVCTIHNQHIQCEGGDHTCPSQHFQQKNVRQTESGAMVITLSKRTPVGQLRHSHFARLTLDSQGKVMKLAVSR